MSKILKVIAYLVFGAITTVIFVLLALIVLPTICNLAVCGIAYLYNPSLFKGTTLLTIVEYCFYLAVPTFMFWAVIFGGFVGNNDNGKDNHGKTFKEKINKL